MESRFTTGETDVLTISQGDTLVVRRTLSAGEKRKMNGRLYMAGATPTSLRVNPLQMDLAMCTAYLLDWSLRDAEGRPVVIRDLPIEELEQVLDNLTPDTFDEIAKAIETHVQAQREKKTIPTGAPPSSATSSSPSAAAGATSGSSS